MPSSAATSFKTTIAGPKTHSLRESGRRQEMDVHVPDSPSHELVEIDVLKCLIVRRDRTDGQAPEKAQDLVPVAHPPTGQLPHDGCVDTRPRSSAVARSSSPARRWSTQMEVSTRITSTRSVGGEAQLARARSPRAGRVDERTPVR